MTITIIQTGYTIYSYFKLDFNIKDTNIVDDHYFKWGKLYVNFCDGTTKCYSESVNYFEDGDYKFPSEIEYSRDPYEWGLDGIDYAKEIPLD